MYTVLRFLAAADNTSSSTYLIHSFDGDRDTLYDLVSNLSDSNLGGMLITTELGYTTVSSMWAQVVEDLDGYKRSTDDSEGDTGDTEDHPRL